MLNDNPVSRFLLSLLEPRGPRAGQPDPGAFVARWDRFEAHVIRVYRAGAADAENADAIAEVRDWMATSYPDYAAQLAPHWAGRLAGGEPLGDDPFARLLAIGPAARFVGRWDAMQLLPAAREALNAWLLSLDAAAEPEAEG